MSEEKEKKAKKEKKEKPVEKVKVKSTKVKAGKEIDPRTGTRFPPNGARQAAFNVIMKCAKKGMKVKEIREELVKHRSKDGTAKKWNLDKGYLNFVVVSHPEFFEVYTDGTVKVIKEPTPDPEAAKKLEEEQKKRKKKAEEARAKRKEKVKKEEKKAPPPDEDEDEEDDDE